MIPQHLRPLFWDIRGDDFDPSAHPGYTIARVLEFGDKPAIAWLRATFSEAAIRAVVRTDHRLTRRSANFWALIYNIPPTEVAALQSEETPSHAG